jgi:predicted patatin/cPLA2 family phospholipase
MMKARIKNNIVEIYNNLPHIYNGITGSYPGGFHLQKDEIHKKEGFFDLIIPTFDPVTQKLGDIYFDGENEIFIYPIEERTDLPTIDVAKAQKIIELKSAVKDLYHTVQWYLEMKRTEGESIPQIIIDKLRSIKTKYEQIKTQINNLTGLVDVLKYELPYSSIQQIKADLEQLE